MTFTCSAVSWFSFYSLYYSGHHPSSQIVCICPKW